MSKRNEAVETLRVLMMFGICLGHAMWQCGHAPEFHVSLDFCVCGFVFISGYFGLKFKWAKLVRLLSLGVFCAIVPSVFAYFTGGGAL